MIYFFFLTTKHDGNMLHIIQDKFSAIIYINLTKKGEKSTAKYCSKFERKLFSHLFFKQFTRVKSNNIFKKLSKLKGFKGSIITFDSFKDCKNLSPPLSIYAK